MFHRLNVMPIELNSLKERTEDIPLLIDYFKKKISELNGVNEANIDTKNNELFTYDWPGNVRELRNLVERVTILSINEKEEDVNELVSELLSKSSMKEKKLSINDTLSIPLKEAREQFEKEYLVSQLEKITATYLKQQTSLEWKGLPFTENSDH